MPILALILATAAAFACGYGLGAAGAVNDLKARHRCFNPNHPYPHSNLTPLTPHIQTEDGPDTIDLSDAEDYPINDDPK